MSLLRHYSLFLGSISLALMVGACTSEFSQEEVMEDKGSVDDTQTLSQQAPVFDVKTPEQIDFRPLNPARGDASPQAGQLWGDIREDVPSGVVLKFADGFSSPPHIHNITYRAVVIEGEIHNDDPEAAKLWMGPGSYWSQPAGEDHITAAKEGGEGISFLEILSGPYLVKPSSEAFDNGERPINMTPGTMTWLRAEDSTWLTGDRNKAEMSLLWQSAEYGNLTGSLLKLPSGQSGHLSGDGSELRAVIIQGDVTHVAQGQDQGTETALQPGGYFMSGEGSINHITCQADKTCLVYIRTQDRFGYKASVQ